MGNFGIRKRRKGQGMTEYIIIVALIAIVLIAAVVKFGGTLNSIWGKSENKLNNEVLKKIK